MNLFTSFLLLFIVWLVLSPILDGSVRIVRNDELFTEPVQTGLGGGITGFGGIVKSGSEWLNRFAERIDTNFGGGGGDDRYNTNFHSEYEPVQTGYGDYETGYTGYGQTNYDYYQQQQEQQPGESEYYGWEYAARALADSGVAQRAARLIQRFV